MVKKSITLKDIVLILAMVSAIVSPVGIYYGIKTDISLIKQEMKYVSKSINNNKTEAQKCREDITFLRDRITKIETLLNNSHENFKTKKER